MSKIKLGKKNFDNFKKTKEKILYWKIFEIF